MEEDARGGLSAGERRGTWGNELPVQKASFASFTDQPIGGPVYPIDLLRDVEVEMTAELGSARMQIKHILGLRPGSVIELDRLAGEPVDLTINKTLIARGEVVVVDEKFAIRIVEIVSPEKRLASSGGG
jgi:flagellar motor switch protein FliN/FliY